MYGAVLDAADGSIDVGECSVICENAVLRAGVRLFDHVFVGPHATLLGCRLERCVYLATGATVLQDAVLGAGAVVAIGAAVHAATVLPEQFFVPPNTIAIDGQVYAPGDPGLPGAIKGVGFAKVAFGIEADWEDRVHRYERAAEVRSTQFAAHADDEIVG